MYKKEVMTLVNDSSSSGWCYSLSNSTVVMCVGLLAILLANHCRAGQWAKDFESDNSAAQLQRCIEGEISNLYQWLSLILLNVYCVLGYPLILQVSRDRSWNEIHGLFKDDIKGNSWK